MEYTGDYVPPVVTVDGVVFQLQAGALSVLLIRRATEPFAGAWALPGGYCSSGETTREALERVLAAKAGLAMDQLQYLEQFAAFDTVARDPRGHALSISYFGLGRDVVLNEGSPDWQQPQFFSVDGLPELAFDHGKIIALARERLQTELVTGNVAAALLPEQFTFTQLQAAYEAVFGREIDKRNFRKRIAAMGLIQETGAMSGGGAHRPAKLYTFAHRDMQTAASFL